MNQTAGPAVEPVLDLRPLAIPQRHPWVYATFESLRDGESLVLVNDHDPRPLHYTFRYQRPGQFTWDYLEQGPDTWRVRIRKAG